MATLSSPPDEHDSTTNTKTLMDEKAQSVIQDAADGKASPTAVSSRATVNAQSNRFSPKDLISLTPRYYAYTYLALMPAFGLLYTYLPNVRFNHDNMTFIDHLYFSAVTITTLGYGDITPINTHTRLLAMVEAVVGVVLVGLFLNAVSYQRQEQVNAKLDEMEERKELALAFSRLRSHDGLIALNMNTYLNRVNQLLGVEHPLEHIDPSKRIMLSNTAKATQNIRLVSTGLWGIYEPMPAPFEFSDLKNLFQSSSRLTDDPNKPQIWYYYQALDDLITSIENLLREADLYRWVDLETLCTNYLIDIKRYNSSSYILAQPNFERQLEQIVAQRQRDMQLISNHPEPVELAVDNDLNPYIILYMGIKTTLAFIEEFQARYQTIMQTI